MKRFPIPMIVCALPLFVGCISDRTSPRTYYHEPTDEDRAYAKRLEGDIKSTEREIRYYSEGFAAKNREKIEAKTKERDELRIQINEEDDRDTRKKFELEARVLLEEINMLKKSTENFQAMASQRILPPAKRSRQEMMQKREEVLGLSPIRVTYCEVHGEKMFKGYVGRRGAPIMPLSYRPHHNHITASFPHSDERVPKGGVYFFGEQGSIWKWLCPKCVEERANYLEQQQKESKSS